MKHEGRDWSKLLLGGRYTPHEAIFGQYDLHHDTVGWLRMIRTPDWKLIRNYVADPSSIAGTTQRVAPADS